MEIGELAAALEGSPAAAGADLLLLHGSRARGDAAPTSDWDVAYLAAPDGDVDPATLLDALSHFLGTDDVDVADLARAGALLRFRAARDGVVLVERRPGAFVRFQLDAVHFWCDAGPVIRAAQADVLASLG